MSTYRRCAELQLPGATVTMYDLESARAARDEIREHVERLASSLGAVSR